jgi:hypothetical protein
MTRIAKSKKANLPSDAEPVERSALNENYNQAFRVLSIQVLRDPASSPLDKFRAMQQLERLGVDVRPPVDHAPAPELEALSNDSLDQVLDSTFVHDVVAAILEGDDAALGDVKAADFPVTASYLNHHIERRVEELATARSRWYIDRELGGEDVSEDGRAQASDEEQPQFDPNVHTSVAPPPPPGIAQWPRRSRRNRRPGIR